MNAAAPRSPRLYRGWQMIGALSITEMISWGILYYGFGVFLPAMQTDLGWSREQLTGAFSVALLTTGLAGAPLGRILDRDGPLIMGCVVVTSSVVVISTLLVDIAYQLLDPRMRVSP